MGATRQVAIKELMELYDEDMDDDEKTQACADAFKPLADLIKERK